MQAAPRSSFQPAGAGAVLVSALCLCTGAGALIGWAAGEIALGAVGGVVVGIPVGVFAVYRRYRGYFS
jgi:hypothetical protein